MLTQELCILLLFNIIEIFNKFQIIEYHQIQKCTSNADLRKQDFLSEEKISHRSGFVNLLFTKCGNWKHL